MRHLILCGLLAIATTVASRADHEAQLVWRGQINGPTTLRINGNRVDVENGSGQVLSTPNHQFSTPLPAIRQDVQVLVRQGRADARVIEQPRANNNFTALVEVTPRRQRAEDVAVELYWNNQETRQGAFSNRGRGRLSQTTGSGSVAWTGSVDQDAVIEIRNGRAMATTLRGQPVYNTRADFSGVLPRSDVSVRLNDARGRGNIELIQQPNAQNGYAAKVRIQDQQSGAGDYSFILAWDDVYANNDLRREQSVYGRYPGNQNLGYGEMRWTGRVDGRVQVHVQGDRAWVTRTSGTPVQFERAAFNGRFSPRTTDQVSVRKLNGRGDVRILESPSARNGYRLVFEIDDRDGGADDYEVEVTW